MTMTTKNPRGRMPNGKPHPIDVHCGARVRQRRIQLGMSQESLGEAIGLTFQQVQKYEKGANRMGMSRIWAIARVLDVPTDYFFAEMPADLHKARNVVQFAKVRTPDHESDRDTMELVRAYQRLPTPKARMLARHYVRDLAEAAGVEPRRRRPAAS